MKGVTVTTDLVSFWDLPLEKFINPIFNLIHFDNAVDLGDKPKTRKESNCSWKENTKDKTKMQIIKFSVLLWHAVGFIAGEALLQNQIYKFMSPE